jgi:two-component system, cell cycle sensor histidine kinase and response regulator CckA
MAIPTLKVLLIEDDHDDFIMVRDFLSEVEDRKFVLDWARTFDEGETRLLEASHDVYLVDYRLSDRTGLDLLRKAMAHGCKAPVIMLTGLGDGDVDNEVLKLGAADYLVKGQINSSLLGRSIRYAIERARTLETLRESEERFHRLSDATLEGIVVHKEGVFLDANETMASMFGYDLAEIIGMHATQFVVPEQRDLVAQHIVNKWESPYEITAVRKDGSTFPAEVFGRAIPYSGEDCRVTAIRDITERKRAEEAIRQSEVKYRTLFEQSRDAIYISSRDGRFLDVNEAALELFGYTRAELLNLDVREIYLNLEDRARFQQEIETRQSVRDYEVRYRRKDGNEIDCLLSASVRLDGSGAIIGYQGIIRDITERKRMEENMLHSQKLKSLGVMAGGIAHDFNNLLMVIMGKAGLARKQLPEDSGPAKALEHISLASQRAADLCRQMLAYAGKGRFVMEGVDLNRVMEDTLQLLQISIGKSVELVFKPQANLPLVEGDVTQIRQVVMNLVVNASEAIGDRDGRITVSTGCMKADRAYLSETYLAPDLPEGDYVYAEVSDTGSGMSPETQARIFDPFFTTKFAGRGLGLAAVIGITRSHRGALKLKSKEGQGSTFRFLLPKASNATVPAAEAPVDENWQGTGTALVIDDEESVRNITTQMLGLLGFEVLTSKDGIQGIETFKANADRISIVMLDLTMPKMNGQQVFREISKIPSKSRTILMSGYNEELSLQASSGPRLAGFLQKPFEIKDLRNKLKAALGMGSLTESGGNGSTKAKHEKASAP